MANKTYAMKQAAARWCKTFGLRRSLLLLFSVYSVAFYLYYIFGINLGNGYGAMKINSSFAFGVSEMNVSVTSATVRSNFNISDDDIGEPVSKVGNSANDGIQSLVDIPTNFNFNHTQRYIKFTILWFNPAEWILRRNKILKLDTCEYNNCQVTEDRQMLPNSSAVIFGITMPNMGTSPPVPSSQRDPNQIWIYQSLEAPIHHARKYPPSWHNTMNWSMTFNFDSDVFSPYGTIKTKHNFTEPDYDAIFNMKTKMAVWVVSNCNSMSRRNGFVTALQNAGISIDIFGACGKKGRYQGNIRDLTKHYKYYLSLENSFCKYYVTEKVIERYEEDVVLLIRGGADYNQLLPSETYVDAAMFENVTSLARHLLDLAADRKRYIRLLKKKSHYYTLNVEKFGYPYTMCNLCRKLNQHDGRRKVYSNLEEEVLRLGRCINPKDIIIK